MLEALLFGNQALALLVNLRLRRQLGMLPLLFFFFEEFLLAAKLLFVRRHVAPGRLGSDKLPQTLLSPRSPIDTTAALRGFPAGCDGDKV